MPRGRRTEPDASQGYRTCTANEFH